MCFSAGGEGAVSQSTACPWPGSTEPETQRHSDLVQKVKQQKPRCRVRWLSGVSGKIIKTP